MNTQKLSNIPLSQFRIFLEKIGCKHTRTKGGHEVWTRKDFLRPVIVQTHIDPVPELVVQNALRNLNMTKKDFFKQITII
jgi:predicted RNA binding protein YcfA (HicA-like mRNA interferase family)